jgi:hypothetical protein
MQMPGDYKIGYGKPPKSGMFKAGTSGNLNGRPKGTKNLKTDLAEELAEMIPVKENGKAKRVSKQRAMLKAVSAKAIKGDTRAAAVLIAMIDRHLSEDTSGAEIDLTETDFQVLEAFKAKVLKGKKGGSNGK